MTTKYSNMNENIYIDIEPENNLIDYTENHFLNKMNVDMEKIRDTNSDSDIFHSENIHINSISTPIYVRDTHSPITISNNNSDDDDELNDDEMDYENINNIHSDFLNERCSERNKNIKNKGNISQNNNENINNTVVKTPKFHKLSYKEIEKSLNQSYNENSKYSNELEILITYLKCQSNLYIQSKNVTTFKLNSLMIPTIFISSFITLLAPFIIEYYWGGSFISGLNAIITLFISLVNYYKFETTNQLFSHLAKEYDKLQTKLEIANSKILFIDNEIEQTNLMMEKIHEFEDKMFEIKENTSIFVPEELKPLFPLICHINIFSLIKKIETYKKTLISKYKDVKNEMRYIFYKYNNINTIHSEKCLNYETEIGRSKKRLLLLVDIKNKLKDEIINYKNAYYYIDQAFTQEIVNAEKNKNLWIWIYFFGSKYNIKENQLIKKYIE